MCYLPCSNMIQAGEDRVKAYITRHMGKFKCIECPHLEFTHKANIVGHIEYYHYSPGYQCEICNKVYKVKRVMVKHLKKHQAISGKKC